MATKSSIVIEKVTVLSDKSAEISDAKMDRINFEGNQPLTEGLDYIVLPQKNFAAEFTVGGNKVTSQRFWIVGIDENDEPVEVRSVGISTLTAMACGWENNDRPTVKTRTKDDGSLGIQSGLNWVYAMGTASAHNFIKGEDHRYVVKTPAMINFTGNRNAYVASFEDDHTLKHNGDTVVLEVRSLKTFTRGEVPSDEQIKVAEEAIKTLKTQFKKL